MTPCLFVFMTPEELLKPRYKVIAAYPGMKGEGLTVGQILKCKEYENDFSEKYWCEMNDEYPHLFKKLEWWGEREIEDMPGYISLKGIVRKVDNWTMNFIKEVFPNHKSQDGNNLLSIEWNFYKKEFIPSTKEEYDLQQLQQNH